MLNLFKNVSITACVSVPIFDNLVCLTVSHVTVVLSVAINALFALGAAVPVISIVVVLLFLII